MKDNKKMIISVILILVIIILVCIFFKITKDKQEKEEENSMKNLEIVNELKEQTGVTGNSNIYEIQQEFDGRQVLTVKTNIKFKVAFAGMIKKSVPTMEELDNILNENLPKENGIWIEKESREKVLNLFNNKKVDSKYTIDNNGYLKIQEKNSQNDFDKKLEKIINGDKLYILDISNICYIVDELTGDIWSYDFKKMDKYQIYEYFEDDNKMIIFINENDEEQVTDDEIFNSIIELF